MPAQGQEIGNRIGWVPAGYWGGLVRIHESVNQLDNFNAMPFALTTGSSSLADLNVTDAATRTLISDARIPTGYRMYVTKVDIAVTGATAWTTGTSINIQDSQGNIIVGIPLAALSANAMYSLPLPDVFTTNNVTVTGSASTTTVVNLSGTPFVAKATNSLVGAYVKGLTGANAGYVRQITDHSTTQFTVGTAFPSAPAAADTFAVYSLQAVATTNGTTLTANAPALTTSAAIGLETATLTGTGPGQSRIVTANTASALTVGTMPTAPDTTTTFTLSTFGRQMKGVSAFGVIGGHATYTAQGAGLQVVQVGTFGAGSAIRLHIEGYITNN